MPLFQKIADVTEKRVRTLPSSFSTIFAYNACQGIPARHHSFRLPSMMDVSSFFFIAAACFCLLGTISATVAFVVPTGACAPRSCALLRNLVKIAALIAFLYPSIAFKSVSAVEIGAI